MPDHIGAGIAIAKAKARRAQKPKPPFAAYVWAGALTFIVLALIVFMALASH